MTCDARAHISVEPYRILQDDRTTIRHVTDNVRYIIEAVRRTNRTAGITIHAVPPTSRNHAKHNKTIRSLNHSLKTLCRSQGVFYITHSGLWSSGQANNTMIHKDGIHLSQAGAQTVLKTVDRFLYRGNRPQ